MNPEVHPLTKVDEARLLVEARRRNLEAAKLGVFNEQIYLRRLEELHVAEAALAEALKKEASHARR